MNQSQVAQSLLHYQYIRDQIRREIPDLDEQTLDDTVDGLTDLNEIIAAVIRASLADLAMVEGLRHRLKEMQGRLERLEQRATDRRKIARNAMLEAGISKIAASDFTASVRSGTPSLTVIDEKKIPDVFWLPQTPKLDRQSMLTAIKQGDKIPGALLSNGEFVLSVRTK